MPPEQRGALRKQFTRSPADYETAGLWRLRNDLGEISDDTFTTDPDLRFVGRDGHRRQGSVVSVRSRHDAAGHDARRWIHDVDAAGHDSARRRRADVPRCADVSGHVSACGPISRAIPAPPAVKLPPGVKAENGLLYYNGKPYGDVNYQNQAQFNPTKTIRIPRAGMGIIRINKCISGRHGDADAARRPAQRDVVRPDEWA